MTTLAVLPGSHDHLGAPKSDRLSLRNPRTALPISCSASGLPRRKHSTQQLKVVAMRAVVQRVKSASVTVEGKLVSSIGPGLLCLVGLADGDTDKDAEYMSRKLLKCRLWPKEDSGKSWDQSVVQKGYDVLLVSQFTLWGILKGNKPDFHLAMHPQQAETAYSSFVALVQKDYQPGKVKTGIFAAMMDVHLVNDGPVTIIVDSRNPGGR